MEALAKDIKPGQILMLENLRFHKEEEKNDPEFSKQLASLADIAVNDAFGVSHRAHASVEGITKYLPAVAGLLMEKNYFRWSDSCKSSCSFRSNYRWRKSV